MLANSYQKVIPRSRLWLLILAAMVVAAPPTEFAPHPYHRCARLGLCCTEPPQGEIFLWAYLYAFPIQQMLFASWGDGLNFTGYFALSLESVAIGRRRELAFC
jgi:hypothetical protein